MDRFTLTIECENDAFKPCPTSELARLLIELGRNLRACRMGAKRLANVPPMLLRDINGNTVGRARYVQEVSEWRCAECGAIDCHETGRRHNPMPRERHGSPY